MAIGNLGLGLGGRRPHDPSAISSQCNVTSEIKNDFVLLHGVTAAWSLKQVNKKRTCTKLSLPILETRFEENSLNLYTYAQ